MDPAISQAIATLISAAATVLLMAGAYYFKNRDRSDDKDGDDE